MHRGFRYRLDPTPEQESTFRQWAGVCRLIYNAALEQREVYWRQFRENTGKGISFASQCRELTQLRAEFDWIKAVSVTAEEQALRDLDTAFRRFFRGIGRYPSMRRKDVNESFRFKGCETRTRQLNGNWSAVLVPKLGWIKYRDTRPIRGAIQNVTVILSAGRWFVSFACEIQHQAPPTELPAVGIDRGVTNTLALSTGEMFSAPASLVAIERRQRHAKHALARKARGSTRYAKQRRRVAAMSARGARIRRDWQHRVTTDLARHFGTVVIEALKVVNMTASGSGKRGLNRSILNHGWTSIATLLTYKVEERGGMLLTVSPAYTSQTCSDCGAIDATSRESQAVFRCRRCGFEAHADHNAAVNILRRSTPVKLAEVAHWGADETRTTNHGVLAA